MYLLLRDIPSLCVEENKFTDVLNSQESLKGHPLYL